LHACENKPQEQGKPHYQSKAEDVLSMKKKKE